MSETFTQYFSRTVTKVRVVSKHDSWLMKAVASILVFLTKLKVVDFPRDKFMNDYTTTIGRTVYSGHMTDESKPNSLVRHEFCHALQWAVHRLGFSLSFLLSKKKRAYWESQACQTSMLMDISRWTEGRMTQQATQLVGYGCDYQQALNELRERKAEVERDEPTELAKRVHVAAVLWEESCVE